MFSHLFLSVLAEVAPRVAQELGCGSSVGGSTIGVLPKLEAAAANRSAKSKAKIPANTELTA